MESRLSNPAWKDADTTLAAALDEAVTLGDISDAFTAFFNATVKDEVEWISGLHTGTLQTPHDADKRAMVLPTGHPGWRHCIELVSGCESFVLHCNVVLQNIKDPSRWAGTLYPVVAVKGFDSDLLFTLHRHLTNNLC